jgi:hypothetical protein
MSSNTMNVFNFLVSKAEEGVTTTYKEVAEACSLPTTGNQLGATLSPLLSNIFLFCELHSLVKLTSIVVRKTGTEQGIPGLGFWKLLERVGPNMVMLQGIASGSVARKRAQAAQYQREVFRLAVNLKSVIADSNYDFWLLDNAENEPELLENLVLEQQGREIVKKKPAAPEEPESALLDQDEVETALAEMHRRIANEFGVTLTHDTSGAWGELGKRYLTLRFGDYTVGCTINSVTSYKADVEHNASINEDK